MFPVALAAYFIPFVIIYVLYRRATSSETMIIHIICPDAIPNAIDLEVRTNETVGGLRARLERETGIPGRSQRFIHQHWEGINDVQDYRTLSSYAIKQGTSIHLGTALHFTPLHQC